MEKLSFWSGKTFIKNYFYRWGEEAKSTTCRKTFNKEKVSFKRFLKTSDQIATVSKDTSRGAIQLHFKIFAF